MVTRARRGRAPSRTRDVRRASERTRDGARKTSDDRAWREEDDDGWRTFGRRAALAAGALMEAALMEAAAASASARAERGGTEAGPNYACLGPYRVRTLPVLEHTCAKCFPMCVGLSCLTRIRVFAPKADVEPDELFPLDESSESARTRASAMGETGRENAGEGEGRNVPRYANAPPYPVAIITPGFLIDGESYSSIARRLCSWGYVVVMYTKTESVAGGTLDDEVSAAILDDLISWVGDDVTVGPYADAERVYLIGHSRGGKISMLQAMRDKRVKAVALLDPVDNTVFAPLGPGFPSALAGMRADPASVPPLVIVGGANGGECAPSGSNYQDFFAAAPRGAAARGRHDPWGFSCAAGHFDFIDEATFVQKVICPDGEMDPIAARDACAALIVAHGERVFRPDDSADSADSDALNRTLLSLRAQFIDRDIDFSSFVSL